MKTFTVTIDDKLDGVLDSLKEGLGKTSRAEVFRLAIALLKVAEDAKTKGRKIAIATQDDRVEKEIVLPG